jgi:hypothetical protein
MGILKLHGSSLLEVRLIYMYAKLRAPSIIINLFKFYCLSFPSQVCRPIAYMMTKEEKRAVKQRWIVGDPLFSHLKSITSNISRHTVQVT